ncbi:MAG: hypothetical protein JO150_10100 [Acidobacteriaceae bacterium]|nr:hypothetical protein [Acidobacteriaceae bacterium]
MIKLFTAAILAVSLAYGADTSKFAGTWKLDAAKGDYSADPNGTPREATLTFKDSGAWTYSATDASGKKFDATSEGGDKVTVRTEPTGNPYIIDTRWISKESGKEVQRALAALLPDGKAVVIYSSGITRDGKAFSNVGYFKKAD